MSIVRAVRELVRVDELVSAMPHDRLPLSMWIQRDIEVGLAAPMGLIGMLDEVAAEFLQLSRGSAGRVPDTGNRRTRLSGGAA